jgi:hypothetical protein
VYTKTSWENIEDNAKVTGERAAGAQSKRKKKDFGRPIRVEVASAHFVAC